MFVVLVLSSTQDLFETEDLACVIGCCQLPPVRGPSRASECVHLWSVHNLLVASLRERLSQRAKLACFQYEHQCWRS